MAPTHFSLEMALLEAETWLKILSAYPPRDQYHKAVFERALASFEHALARLEKHIRDCHRQLRRLAHETQQGDTQHEQH